MPPQPVTSTSWFNGSTKTGKYVLTQNITITDDRFVELSGISAEFDGREYTIFIAGGITDFHGLFKLTNGATVKNVDVQVARVDGKTDSTLFSDYRGDHRTAGWLVRSDSSGNVLDCNSNGDANNEGCGGVVGAFFCGLISGCECTGNVTSSYCGGIVGTTAGLDWDGNGVNTVIVDCVMRGNIEPLDELNEDFTAGCGGIVGDYLAAYGGGTFSVTVNRCVMLGESVGDIVNVGDSRSGNHGGIVGGNAGRDNNEQAPNLTRTLSVTNCYCTSKIGFVSGGIVGRGFGYGYGPNCTVSKCYSSGHLMGTAAAGIASDSFSGVIDSCFSLGDIGVSPLGAVPGDQNYSNYLDGYLWYAAGIVLATARDRAGNDAVITNCYVAGNILADGCGGICVVPDRAHISNCYYSGQIIAPYSAGLFSMEGEYSTGTVYVTGGKLFVSDAGLEPYVYVDPSANIASIRSIVPSGWDIDVWAPVSGGYPVLKAFLQPPWSRYSVYTDAPILRGVTARRLMYPMTRPLTNLYESVRLLGKRSGRLMAVYEQYRKRDLQGIRASVLSSRALQSENRALLLQRGDVQARAITTKPKGASLHKLKQPLYRADATTPRPKGAPPQKVKRRPSKAGRSPRVNMIDKIAWRHLAAC